jgi:hypothetical protein
VKRRFEVSVDVGAVVDVHPALKLRRDGSAVVVVNSDVRIFIVDFVS